MRKINVLLMFLCLFAGVLSFNSDSFASTCDLDVCEYLNELECMAVTAITDDGRSKKVDDVVRVSDRETAVGFAHFTAERDPFDLGWYPPFDSEWEEDTGEWLCSGPGIAAQVAAWRRIVLPALREADEAGCIEKCRATVAAIANSSPVRARQIGAQANWIPEEMLKLYATNDHRRRRAERIRRYILTAATEF